jgi:glycosyltransferase involved in cell wall biosynthesis
MKVLFQLLDAGLGGGQLVATRVGAELAVQGAELGLMVPAPGPATEAFAALGADLIERDLGTLRRPDAAARAAPLVRGYDLLYTHTSVPGATLAAAAARLARRPLVVHQHSALHFSGHPPTARLQRLLFAHAVGRARVIAVADHIAAQLVDVGLDPRRVDMIPNGVPLPAPSPSDPGRPPTIGILARVDPGKGIDTFVEAARLLQGRGIRFVAGVVAGPFAEFEVRLRAGAAAAGVELIESVDGETFLRDIDILAFPSRHEGSPLVLLEALALGVPVVAADVPGVREIVEPEGAAALVPAGDAQALADTLGSLVDDASRRASLGERGRAVVASRYRLESMLDRTIAILESEAAGG